MLDEVFVMLKDQLAIVLKRWAESQVIGVEEAPLTDINKRLILVFGLLKSFDERFVYYIFTIFVQICYICIFDSSLEYLQIVIPHSVFSEILGSLRKIVIEEIVFNSISTDEKKMCSFESGLIWFKVASSMDTSNIQRGYNRFSIQRVIETKFVFKIVI